MSTTSIYHSLALLLLLSLMLVLQSKADITNHETNLDPQTSRADVIAIQRPKPQPEPAVVIQQRPASEIEINSLDGSSDRHHYEQSNDQPGTEGSKPPVQMLDMPVASNNDADLYDGPSKPEPRNQVDEIQQQDPAIIDHRPNQQQQQQQQPLQDQTVVTQPDYTATQQQTTTLAPPPMQSTQSSNNVYQQQATQTPATSQQVAPAPASTNWYPQQAPATYSQSAPIQAQQVQQQTSVTASTSASAPVQQYGSQAAASNQMVAVQHPNSINAIINGDHQSQSPLPVQQQQPAMQAAAIQQQPQSQIVPATSNQQQQLVTVNGQPMILMNPNAVNGGRRISIASWFKGLSSMLANIFNRREHGQLNGVQSGGGLSHWIQLGPNAPHWLSNAQTTLQQQQYQHQQQYQPQMVASTRYTTYVQAPSAVNAQVQPVVQPMVQQQQQVPIPQQVNNYQPQQVSSQDMQVSGSSTSYVTMAPPAQFTQSQAIVSIGGTAPASLSQASIPIVRQQTSQPIQQQQQQQQQQVVPIQQQSQVTRATVVPAQQQQQQQQQPQQQPVQGQGPIRFSRSSVATNSGLPLAHYSRYGATLD